MRNKASLQVKYEDEIGVIGGYTKIDEGGQVREKGFRGDYYGDIEVNVIDHEERYRCNGWEEYFVSPAYIEDIVGDSKYCHTLQA